MKRFTALEAGKRTTVDNPGAKSIDLASRLLPVRATARISASARSLYLKTLASKYPIWTALAPFFPDEHIDRIPSKMYGINISASVGVEGEKISTFEGSARPQGLPSHDATCQAGHRQTAAAGNNCDLCCDRRHRFEFAQDICAGKRR